MSRLSTAKRTIRIFGILIWVFIALAVAGPILGSLSLRFPQMPLLGSRVDLNSIPPQVQTVFQSGNLSEAHAILIPVDNEWFFTVTAKLTLSVMVDGQIVYRSPPAEVVVAPLDSDRLTVVIQIPKNVTSQLSGKQIGVGGQLTLGAPIQLWSVTLTYPTGQ